MVAQSIIYIHLYMTPFWLLVEMEIFGTSTWHHFQPSDCRLRNIYSVA